MVDLVGRMASGPDPAHNPQAMRNATPTPAVAECVLGRRDLWRIHRDELAIKRALVDELTCDALMSDLEEVKALFAAEPNLDPDAVRRLVDSILDATPDPQSRRR